MIARQYGYEIKKGIKFLHIFTNFEAEGVQNGKKTNVFSIKFCYHHRECAIKLLKNAFPIVHPAAGVFYFCSLIPF